MKEGIQRYSRPRVHFHKAESAFFVFIALVLGAGVLLAFAYGSLQSAFEDPEVRVPVDLISDFATLLFAACVLLATALFFGVFFIYPLIRIQAKEENKLRAMTVSLNARSETLQHAAMTDGLTGLQNRRDDALREYLHEFGKIDKPIGLIIIDLDHFKQINDNHGHDVGDQVLRAVSGCLRGLTRYHDVVARLGGEEFGIVAPDMEMEALTKFGERVRRAISKLVVEDGNVRLTVTASLGLAVSDGAENPEELYKRADRMLYKAKRTGRNRICA
jgi:diguanylate cyclase (GGDEF)-like protein